MATITSTTSGDWGTGGTWVGGVAPASGDTAVIATGHTVTVNDARTCAGWTQQGTGVLAISGTGALTSTGNCTIEGDGNNTPKVTLAAGGSLLWNPGSGNTVTLKSGTDYFRYCGIDANGSSGSRCAIGKASGADGTLLWRHGDGGLIWMNGLLDAEYTDFDGWGTSGSDAAELYPRHHGEFRMVNCRVRDGGRWNIACYNMNPGEGYTGEFTLIDTTFTGTLSDIALIISGNGDGTGATVTRCDFDKGASFNLGSGTPTNLTLEDCIFRGPLAGNWPAAYVASSGHFWHNRAAQDNTFPATHSDSYQFIYYAAGGNPHYWSPAGSGTLEDCIFEYRGPFETDTGDVFLQQFGSCTLRRCIILPSSVANKTSGDTAWLGGDILTLEHNTIYVGDAQGVLFPHSSAMGADKILARSNIFWTDSTGVAFFNDSPGTSDLDALDPDSVTDNAFVGLATDDNIVGGVSTPLVGFIDCEFSVAPSTNLELSAGAADFVDATRDFLSWARTVRSHSGTDDEVMELAVDDIEADKTLVRLSLLPWVRAGFAPQNAALETAAHDGTTIGAVEYSAPADPLAIGAPSATTTGHHTVQVTWSAATGGTAPYTYQVQKAPDVAGSPGSWTSVSGATTSPATVPGLDPETTYHFRVVATDDNAEVANSAADSATTTIPDILGYALWWTRMKSLAAQMNVIHDTIDESNWNANAHINHDGIFAAIQGLQLRPGDTDLIAYRDHQIRIYRGYYVEAAVPIGQVPGYYLFPEGFALHWELDGDTASRDALIGLRENGVYVNYGDGAELTIGGSREAAYALLVHILADKHGLHAWDQTRVDALVNASLNDITSWTGDTTPWAPYIQSFMFGITGVVLAKYLDHIEENRSSTDARIVPALAKMAVRMRERWWRPDPGDFVWRITPENTNYDGDASLADVLTLESMPFFGWVYKRTGNDYFATAGDEAFELGIDTNDVYNPKQYNQLYRWSFHYVDWRQATPGTENDFYVADGPVIQTGEVGAASGTFVVVPMANFTGTITPSDNGGGGTFVPLSRTWSGTHEVQTFTYVPSTVGTKTISFTNTGALTNPPDLTYLAVAAVAETYTVTGPTTGVVGVASTAFTVTPDATFTGTVTPSDNGAGGTFTPSSLSWTGTQEAKTFTYTPLTTGAKTLSFANSGDLTDAANRTYTATAVVSTVTVPEGLSRELTRAYTILAEVETRRRDTTETTLTRAPMTGAWRELTKKTIN